MDDAAATSILLGLDACPIRTNCWARRAADVMPARRLGRRTTPEPAQADETEQVPTETIKDFMTAESAMAPKGSLTAFDLSVAALTEAVNEGAAEGPVIRPRETQNEGHSDEHTQTRETVES